MFKKEFLEYIENFLKKNEMAKSTFGYEALKDPSFVDSLRKGRECLEKTQIKVMAFIENYQRKK